MSVFLVSDALAPLGLPDGIYPWDKRQIIVKNGTARLPDGTLAGTTLPHWWERKIWYAGVLVKWEARLGDPRTPTRTPSGLDRGKPAAQLLRWHLMMTRETNSD